MTRVFDQVFSEFTLLIFNEQCFLTKMVKYSEKMHLMLCLAPTVDQQVIVINGHEFIQHIMEARIHEVLKVAW